MPEMSKAVTFTDAQAKFIERLMRACESKGAPGYGLVSFQMDGVQPPSTEYLTRDSYLQVNIYPTSGTDIITVAWKILDSSGKLNVSQATFSTFTVNALNQFILPLTEGFLMSLAVTNATVAVAHRGHDFVQVGIQMGAAAGTPFYRVLASGYPTHQVALGWPEGTLNDSLTGPGELSTATPAPAAGADWSVSLPSNSRIWLHSISATLTTAVAVANRNVIITLQDYAGNVIWQCGPTVTQAASLVYIYNAGEALTLSADVNNNKIIALPEEVYIYGAGSAVIKSVTQNIQAADQWSGVCVVYEKWFDS